jgi:hypothetical protein
LHAIRVPTGDQVVDIARRLQLLADDSKLVVDMTYYLDEISNASLKSEREIQQLLGTPVLVSEGKRRLALNLGKQRMSPVRRSVLDFELLHFVVSR